MATWILVADAARARIFSVRPREGWHLEQSLEHAKSRAKGIDLMSDAAGSVRQSFRGAKRPAMAPHTPPKDVEAEHFARELGGALLQGLDARAFQSLVVVAPPRMLGVLRRVMPHPVQRVMSVTIDADYTQVPDHELPSYLGAAVGAA